MHHTLRGKVIRGDGWGRDMGYPTANLDRRYFARHPVPDGVWACRVKIQSFRQRRIRLRRTKFKIQRSGSWLKGVAVIGIEDKQRGGRKVEVHILDFDKNIYGWYGEAELVGKLRPLKKCQNEMSLVSQIKKDILRARKILYLKLMAVSYPHPLPTDKILPVIDDVRAVKKLRELAAIRRGAAILARVFQWVRDARLIGRTEQQVTQDIARVMKRHGAEALAFPIIVASGPGSADIHHWPTKRKIRKGDVLMLDCGVVVRGYCSDCTRTFFVGNPSKRFINYYQKVLRAQERAIAKVHHGVKAKIVDRAARGYLARWRWGKSFRHRCGHGVGLAIHEFPNLKPKSEDILKAGMVVTIEPGIYIKGWGGIRIEDMVWVKNDRAEILTKSIPQRIEDIVLA